VSTARTVLRNLWLLDFLEIFMGELSKNCNATLKEISKEAYWKGIACHHSWIVK
jgi:hypothetical protein